MTTMAATARILVVDDEPEIIHVLKAALSSAGYEVRAVDDGEAALCEFEHWKADLIITDLSMSRMGGIALCRAIRSSSKAPIIVLSVKDQDTTKVLALEAGADDYLTKPFSMLELMARVRVALRRGSASAPDATVLTDGDFCMDVVAYRVEVRGKETRLTPKEFELLKLLLRNARKLLTHKEISAGIWGSGGAEQADAVCVLVRQLRQKIEPNPAMPKYLKTEPWVGYRFEPGGPDALGEATAGSRHPG
jgi:two-component system KDP operon response regulator KdpE